MITVDRRTMRVSKDGVLVALTPAEFRLLARLAADPGRVYLRAELLVALGYREEAAASIETRTVDAHVYRLRKKLGPSVVRCADGFGYALEPDRVEVGA